MMEIQSGQRGNSIKQSDRPRRPNWWQQNKETNRVRFLREDKWCEECEMDNHNTNDCWFINRRQERREPRTEERTRTQQNQPFNGQTRYRSPQPQTEDRTRSQQNPPLNGQTRSQGPQPRTSSTLNE